LPFHLRKIDMHLSKLFVSGLTALASTVVMAQSPVGGAVSLQAAFEKAKTVDPLYRAGLAEFEGNTFAAQAAGYAYLPQLKLSSSQLESEAGGRRDSLSLIQPVLSADRIATFREKEPRTRLADAQLALREIDLAKRMYTAFSELTLARESLNQNKARLTALELQVTASKRLLTLSQGTTTDVRDAEVKLLQARGEELRLRGQVQMAERAYMSIVGESPAVAVINVNPAKVTNLNAMASDVGRRLSNPMALVDQNPSVVVAHTERELADLDAFRARSAWMPEVNVVHTQTRLDGSSNSFTGLNLSLPLSAGNYASMQSAGAKAAVSAAEAVDVQRQTLLEIERLKTVVEFGANEVAMQQAAVEAAQLSVEANEKSFRGGVRSSTDVLNSIEVLYTVKTDLAKSLLTLSDGLLNLRLIEGNKAADSLAEVETLIFR